MWLRCSPAAVGLGALGLAALIFTPAAQAQGDDLTGPGRAPVVNSAASGVRAQALEHPRRGAVYIVRRPVVEPGAVVRRELHEQPTYPHLVELHRGGTTTYIDPTVNYLAKRPGHLPQGHSIIKAQLLHNARQARGAHVIRNKPRTGHADSPRPAAARPHPIFRLEKPHPTPPANPTKVAVNQTD